MVTAHSSSNGLSSKASSVEKAAILLATLEDSLAVDLLKKFEPAEVKLLIESSKQLGILRNEDVEPVIQEFARDLSSEQGISAGLEQLIALLQSAFSAEQIAEFLDRPISRPRENVWKKLVPGLETTVVPYLLDQHEQVAAAVLSKLQPDLAARCMSLFPRSARNRIARRLLGIGDIYPPAFELMQDLLLEDLFAKGASSLGKSSEGKGLLAALINKLERSQSLEVLDDLAKSNPSDMTALRKMIFMFEDIPQLAQKDRMKLIDRVPVELIIAALFGMEDEYRAAILSSMSARTKRMVESELQGDTSQPNKDTMAARRKIADMAISLAQKSEIDLPQANEGSEASSEPSIAA